MYQIGFIGCGNMGSAMVQGILAHGLFDPEQVVVTHLTGKGAAGSRDRFGVRAVLDNGEAARNSRLLVLAVKPRFYREVLEEIRPYLTEDHILLGLAPGKTMKWIRETAGRQARAARIMPNMPASVGAGMTALCVDADIRDQERELLTAVCECFGKCCVIPEHLMDAAGAVGGCGPAFAYMFMEAMADAAVLEGMPREMAYLFASQTLLGSAKMLQDTGLHPGALKDQVCSPGGTTIEGVRVLERMGLRGAVMEGLAACAAKGRNL